MQLWAIRLSKLKFHKRDDLASQGFALDVERMQHTYVQAVTWSGIVEEIVRYVVNYLSLQIFYKIVLLFFYSSLFIFSWRPGTLMLNTARRDKACCIASYIYTSHSCSVIVYLAAVKLYLFVIPHDHAHTISYLAWSIIVFYVQTPVIYLLMVAHYHY